MMTIIYYYVRMTFLMQNCTPSNLRTYVCKCTHKCPNKYTQGRAQAYTRPHAHTSARTHARTHTHTHAHTHTRTHARTHTHTCAHTHTRTRTHTHTRTHTNGRARTLTRIRMHGFAFGHGYTLCQTSHQSNCFLHLFITYLFYIGLRCFSQVFTQLCIQSIQPIATMFGGHLGKLELNAVGLSNTVRDFYRGCTPPLCDR